MKSMSINICRHHLLSGTSSDKFWGSHLWVPNTTIEGTMGKITQIQTTLWYYFQASDRKIDGFEYNGALVPYTWLCLLLWCMWSINVGMISLGHFKCLVMVEITQVRALGCSLGLPWDLWPIFYIKQDSHNSPYIIVTSNILF